MLYGYSLIEDQRYFLKQILDGLEAHRIDAIILAGDIYDRAIPSQEAIDLFDAFVDALINEKTLSDLLYQRESRQCQSAEFLPAGS